MPFNRPIPESKRPPKASNGFASLVEAEKLLQVAFVLPSAVGIGWLAGALADSLLHQKWDWLAGWRVGRFPVAPEVDRDCRGCLRRHLWAGLRDPDGDCR